MDKHKDDDLHSQPIPQGMRPEAEALPYGDGRQDAAIFNGVHRVENDGRPSVDTGSRLHSSTLLRDNEELKNASAAPPATSQGALAQDLKAAELTQRTDPIEVPKKTAEIAKEGKAK